MNSSYPPNARIRSGGIFPIATAWALLGLLLAALYPASEWQATVGILMVSQAFCGALTWQRFRATATAVLPDFLSIYLFMQFIGKVLTALGMVVANHQEAAGRVGDFMSVYEKVPLAYQFQAELVFLLAMVVFTLVWQWLEGRSILAVWRAPSTKAMWWTYGISLLTYFGLIASSVGTSLGMIQDLVRLFSIGAIAILLGGNSRYALGRPRFWLPIAALLPFYVLALQSGMKGEVALVSLPILLPIFRRLTANRALFLGAFITFVVLFLFPFSQAWRQSNWFAQESIGIQAVASKVADKWERDGFLETAAESTAHWLSRGSSSEQGGLVMRIAERDGLIGPILIEGLATIFIPRFLWPDKPMYQPGAWFTWYLGYANSPEEATTSTAMMLPTELYWMFGISGVIGGMAMLAWLYFQCWRFLSLRAAYRVIPLVALFALLARSSGIEGLHTIYAVSSPIMLVVYVLIFDFAQRHLMPGLSRLTIRKRGA